jgi:thioredoxin reductase
MAIDTPARIAVLGAGPIGLEAALYGRFLGYDVDVYDQGRVAENVQRWGHVRMFSGFGMNASTLGLAAIAAQDPGFRAPDAHERLTGRQYVQRYLQPLAETDLLSDHLQLMTRVVGVSRQGLLKDRPIGADARQDAVFELLVEDVYGERRATADVVIDATGTYQTSRWLGAGGMPAIGERALRDKIDYQLPDVLGDDRSRFAGARTLVVGSGYSAATTVVALAQLAVEHTQSQVLWLTRHEDMRPLPEINNDPLPARAQLAREANRLASKSGGSVRHMSGSVVQRVSEAECGRFDVEIAGPTCETIRVDRIVAQVGYRPDHKLVRELQVHQCYVTEGPMRLAASLRRHPTTDFLSQPVPDPETLVTTEPRYFVLGSKSYGRNSHFLIAGGLDQIRAVFSFLADRQDLNLYANIQHLLP